MTCIVGLVAGERVIMGADSAGVAGLRMMTRKDGKLFLNGEYIFGFTTSFRMGQLLHHALKIPNRHPNTSIEEFMCTTFIDAVRQCLKDGGYARRQHDEETGGAFLVGYAGRLFHIEGDYQVGESTKEYDAVGCGADIALGALYATSQMPAMTRLTIALQAAEHFSAGVRGPYNFAELAGNSKAL